MVLPCSVGLVLDVSRSTEVRLVMTAHPASYKIAEVMRHLS
jgi:hypothetical protein